MASGCGEYQWVFSHDPGGGPLTDSEACVYDFDRQGLWYVLLIRREGLLAAEHRHAAGHHLFLNKQGDMIFFSRCSGRGEVLDVMGTLCRLKQGQVIAYDAARRPPVHQLSLKLPNCKGDDPVGRARILADLARQPEIAQYFSVEGRARLIADYELLLRRHKQEADRQKKDK
jgi:hypothetical protein